MKTTSTILVCGMIAADPWQGGATWAVLQYVLGLRRLGYDVYLVETISEKSLRPIGCALSDSENARYFGFVAKEFELTDHAVLLRADTQQTIGLSYDQVKNAAARAEVLINISGMLTDEALTQSIPIRVYLDIDPAFNQLWSAVQGIDMRFDGHTHYLTIGQAIGDNDCPVPTCGLPWLKTLQPVVLDRWPVAKEMTCDALTTIGNWRAYGSIDHKGILYGQKAHSLRQFMPLPMLTDERFVLALGIHPDETKDLSALRRHGWQLENPERVAHTPASYQQFVQGSKVEFGIAKSGYVASRCGWFSDRSICYLASGRPVIAQETGFSRYLPTGEGLFSFESSVDILEAIDELKSNYSLHSTRAREIAETYFDSDKVLKGLLEQVTS